MALFSRRKKSVDDSAPAVEEAAVEAPAEESADPVVDDAPVEAPAVGISVQTFRGIGAEAGPEIAPPADGDAPAEPAPAAAPRPSTGAQPTAAPVSRALPLAPALPPEQTETVPGMKDNVLLREALAQIEEGATNEQLLGVLRQALQGHLYLRVHGDARAQLEAGEPLSIAIVRDGDNSYMLGFSSAAAVRDAVQRETEPTATSAIAQPVTAVLKQVVDGGFTGLIIDNASAPHRVVFPLAVLEKALEQADADMTLKTLLAAPRQADTAAEVGRALVTTKAWVAVNAGGDGRQPGIAEAQTTDGKRYLQLFSHPLEVVALGRGDRPLPFSPEQLAKVLTTHPEIAGVLLDSAGPSIVVERDALAPVLVLAVDLGD